MLLLLPEDAIDAAIAQQADAFWSIMVILKGEPTLLQVCVVIELKINSEQHFFDCLSFAFRCRSHTWQ